MAFVWTKQRIDRYLDASRHGDFHRRLADTIRPYLLPQNRLCDLGCGLGRLDLALAPAVQHITCVDTDEAVLANLRQAAAAGGITNLSALCADVREIQEVFDVAIMAFFGHPPGMMLDCLRLASRALIRIANVHAEGAALQPSAHSKKRETVESIAALLKEAGCSYTLLLDTFEFGQPLRSQADAAEFLRCNTPAITDAELNAFLSQRLTSTGRADFPFCLPGKKELGIFIIHPLPPG